jgi:sarcosine oxidase subunit beta
MAEDADYLIVGAGVVGLSIAAALASEGKGRCRVLLIDRSGYGTAASGSNLGQTSVSDRDPGLEHRLVMESLAAYEELQERVDVEFLRNGGLATFESPDQVEAAVPLVEQKRREGFKIELLTGSEVKRQEPHIENLAGAVYSPEEGRINPFRLNSYLYDRFIEAGGEFRRGCRAERLLAEAGRVRGVLTDSGEDLRAGVTVLATGAWTRELCASLGLDVPVDYIRGTAMITQPMPRILNGPVVGEFFTGNVEPGTHILFGGVQEARGGIIISQANREVENYDTEVDYDGICGMAAKFLSHFPLLEEVSIVRAWSGVTTVSRLDHGLWGFSSRYDGLFFAAAFKGAFSLAPAVGKYSAGMLKGRQPPAEAEAWSPERCGV